MSLPLTRLLRRHAGRIGLERLPAGGQVRFALINGAPSVRSKLVYLCWAGRRPSPAFVVKSARDARYNMLLEQEARALTQLPTWRPAGPARVPRLLLSSALDGRAVMVETFLPGRRLRDVLRARPGAARHLLQRAVPLLAWLAELQRHSARLADAGDLEAHVFRPFATAAAELPLSQDERARLAQIEGRARLLAGREPLPLVFAHHDLGPHNVLVAADGSFAGVIDWEDGAFGLPASDLFFFLTAFAAATETVAAPAADQQLFFGPVESIAGRWLRAYCHTAGLAPAWLLPLFALNWLWHIAAENRYRATLREEGYLLDGGPSQVRAVPLDTAEHESSAYRRRLRFLLQHLDAFAPGASA